MIAERVVAPDEVCQGPDATGLVICVSCLHESGADVSKRLFRTVDHGPTGPASGYFQFPSSVSIFHAYESKAFPASAVRSVLRCSQFSSGNGGHGTGGYGTLLPGGKGAEISGTTNFAFSTPGYEMAFFVGENGYNGAYSDSSFNQAGLLGGSADLYGSVRVSLQSILIAVLSLNGAIADWGSTMVPVPPRRPASLAWRRRWWC